MIQLFFMSEHSHHTSKSLPVNILNLEAPDLIQQCYLNVESTKYNSKKSTLLLLHGYLGETQDYHEFFHIYNKKYNIIACDLRGHGKSDPCTNPNNSIRWTIEDFASDIYQIVKQIVKNDHKVIVIASSLSTGIALQLATDYPETVDTLFLISPTCKFIVPKWSDLLLFFEKILPKKVMRRMTTLTSTVLLKLYSKHKDPNKRRVRKLGIERFQKLQWSTHRKILTQALKLWKADASAINHSVFIVAGTVDKIVPYRDSLQIFHLLENAAILTIQSKHQILITQIKLITNILDQWLEYPDIILKEKSICGDDLIMIDNKFKIPIIS